MQVIDSTSPRAPEPQRVQLRVGGRVWVTWALIAANVLAFVWMMTRGADLQTVSGRLAYELGANQYDAVRIDGEWWRLIVSVFLHGGIIHLGFNMWALRVLGPFAEAYLGAVGFLVLYLITGIGASVVSIHWNHDAVSLGASGAIFALLGATLAFFVRHRREMPDALFRGQLRTMLMLIGINLVLGFTIPHVDNSAHLGGLGLGFLGGFLMDRPLREKPHMTTRRWVGAGVLAVTIVPIAFVVDALGRMLHGPV